MRITRKTSRYREDNSQNSNKKIDALEALLQSNRNTQHRLTSILVGLENRIRQLEQAGAQYQKSDEKIIRRKQDQYLFVQPKPQSLIDQHYIRFTPERQINFVRAITAKKQVRLPKAEQVGLKKLGSSAKRINFIQQCHKSPKQGQIPLDLYKKWRDTHIRKQKNKQRKVLQQVQEQQLVERKILYGDNWQKVGFCYNGLTFEDIYYLYHNKLCPRDLGKWTLRQNLMLIALVSYFGRGKWATVSHFIKTKSQFQCRQRFCNVLDPDIVQNIWNQEDQILLLEVAQKFDYKWSKITIQVQKFRKKTDNALRRKFRNLIMKLPDQEIDQKVQKKQLAKSIKKFKEKYYNRKKKKKDLNKNQSQDDGSQSEQKQMKE